MSDRQGGRRKKPASKPRARGKAALRVAASVPANPSVETAAPLQEVITEPATPAPAGTLSLGALCTLREAAELKTALLTRLAAEDDVHIDGSAVERIDTAGLQLLAAFARSLTESGRRLLWQAETPELRRAAAQLSLVEDLGLAVPGSGVAA